MVERKKVFADWPKGHSDSLKKVMARKDHYARFMAADRQVQCDESEAAFDARLKKTASAQLSKQPAKKPKKHA